MKFKTLKTALALILCGCIACPVYAAPPVSERYAVAVVDYARNNYQKDHNAKIQCAEFVFRCLKAAGLNIPNAGKSTSSIVDELPKNGFTKYTLTPTIKNGKTVYLATGENEHKIAVGDVLAYKCSDGACGNYESPNHVAVVTKIDNNGVIYRTQTNGAQKDGDASNFNCGRGHNFYTAKNKELFCFHYTGNNTATAETNKKPATNEIRVYVDSNRVTFDGQGPVIKNGRTLVPVRAIANAINKEVSYSGVHKTVLISDNQKSIKMLLNSKIVIYNEKGKPSETNTLWTAPEVIKGTTMLPARDVVSFFGYNVTWDAESKTIFINSTNEKGSEAASKPSADASTPSNTTSEKITYSNPLKGKKLSVTAGFYYNDGTYHGGIDFVAAEGTPLYPVMGGQVLFANVEKRADGSLGNGGNCVLIKGNDGYYYYYAHLKEIYVKKSQTVDISTPIGLTGKTTGNPNGVAAHLHLAICIPKGSSISVPAGSGVKGTGATDWYGNHEGIAIDAKKFLQEKGVLSENSQSSAPSKPTPTPAPTAVNITATTSSAKNITQTNAVIYGKVTKDPSAKISITGFRFGTSSSNMAKVVEFKVDAASNSHNSGKSFDVWCDMNEEANMKLKAGTKYYYQCFATYNGKDYTGSIKSFTTEAAPAASKPTPAPEPTPAPKPTPAPTQETAVFTPYTTSADNITQTNAVINGSIRKDASTKISTTGFYFGSDSKNMKKVVTFTTDQATNNLNKGKSFTDACNLNKDVGIKLTPGTTYYYRYFAVSNGIELTGARKNFTTESTSAPTT